MKQGFTLIELGIVLVIIGLLMSGILVAQSMISTGKINKFAREIQQFDAAVINFHTKFNSLPGDTTKLTPAGNEDGLIKESIANDDIFTGEAANFWPHLAASGMKGQYSNALSGGRTIIAGTHCPSTSIGNDTCAVVAIETANGGTWDTLLFNNRQVNFYTITGFSKTSSIGTIDNVYSITAADALAADKKMDDGVANAGNVKASGSNGWTNGTNCLADGEAGDLNGPPCSAASTGCVSNSNAALYNIDSTKTYPCALGIVLHGQTGSL